MTKTYIVTFIAHIRQHIVKTNVTSKTTDMLILRLLKTRNNVRRKRDKVATKRHIVRQNRRTNAMYTYTNDRQSVQDAVCHFNAEKGRQKSLYDDV